MVFLYFLRCWIANGVGEECVVRGAEGDVGGVHGEGFVEGSVESGVGV